MTPTRLSIARYYAKDYLMAISKKRFLALALSVIVGGSIVAACNTDTEVDGTAVPTTTAAQRQTAPAAAPAAATYTAPTATASDEDRFVALLEMQDFNYGGDEDLVIDTGHATCDALDRGASVAAVLSVIVSEGYSGYDAGTFLGASVFALCDEHVGAVEKFMDQFGGSK